ncbi:MAG: hypothetical protein VX278_12315, partial [Myxococcota bacterium]|nr:hypothetical protein [Myxococcota bacterium]
MNNNRLFLFLLSIACGSEKGVTSYNATPEATITSHTNASQVQEGYEVALQGIVTDANHSAGELSVTWSSDQRELCAPQSPQNDGVTLCRTTLQSDESEIRLLVVDPESASSLASIQLEVLPTEVPIAEILAPQADGNYYSDIPISFSARILDAEDPSEELSFSWESSVDGTLNTTSPLDADGNFETEFFLSEGSHTISLRVEDLTGKVGQDSVDIVVNGPNNLPSCSIFSPATGSAFRSGENIRFEANAIDADLEYNALYTQWTSDQDGNLGIGTLSADGIARLDISSLSTNPHSITFTLTDDVGSSCADSISLSIGTPPIVSIDAPTLSSLHAVGDSITFQATVTDSEDFLSDVSVAWSSDIDGVFFENMASGNGESLFSFGNLSAGYHNITVEATDSIGLQSSSTTTIQVNTLPTAPEVTLSPDPAQTSDNLNTVVSGAFDEDDDAVSFSYAWTQNGNSVGVNTASIDASQTNKGDIWRVRVTPNDGFADGPYTEASITISNTSPVISQLSIVPTVPNTNDTVTCATTVLDADNETLVEDFVWTNTTQGTTIGSGSTITLSPALVSPGDILECQYTVEDDDASDSDSAVASIGNIGPTVAEVLISPSVASVGTSLTCSLTVDDPDLESYSEDFVWTNLNTGSVLGVGSTLTIDGSLASPTDEVQCTGTVIDPSGASGSGQASIVLVNQDPLVASISFSPATAALEEYLVCEATVEEPDEETPTVTYAWTDANGNSLGSDAVLYLDSTQISGGDLITCTATATDGYGGSDSFFDNFIIENTDPTITSLSISPAAPVSSDEILCTGTANDLDGETLVESYTWENQNLGLTLGTGSSLTLSALTASPGDVIQCTYTVSDGQSSVSQDTYATIENQAPVVSSIAITPSSSYNDSLLSCTPSIDELDLESYTTSYSWINDNQGSILGTSNTLQLSSVTAASGDVIRCTVTVDDASGATQSSSDVVTLLNRPPTIDSIELDSSTISLSETITCSATSSDPDDESTTISYVWNNDTEGTTIATTASLTLDSSMATGLDQLSCVATATDAAGDTSSDSIGLSVESTAPEFTTDASISPASGISTSSVLNCVAAASDPDGGSITLSYEWSNGSNVIGSLSSITLGATLAQPTDEITCTVTATDDTAQTATSTDSVIVENTAPIIDSIAIVPSSGLTTSSALTCTASISDADGESLTPSYEWSNGGTIIGTGDALTLTPSLAQPSDTILCTASVFDAYGASDTSSASVAVDNTAPTIDSISITPDPAYNDDTITCNQSSSDADNQTLSESYVWTNTTTGAVLGSGTSL